jgi:hypothetical protein
MTRQVSDTLQIPTITLWQPWATWIARGWKTIETRGHDRFRKLAEHWIAIHAGGRMDNSLTLNEARALMTNDQKNRCGPIWPPKFGPSMPGRAIVCVAFVSQVRWLTEADSIAALCPCYGSRFGLVLTNVIPLEHPIAADGHQGVWKWNAPQAVVDMITQKQASLK